MAGRWPAMGFSLLEDERIDVLKSVSGDAPPVQRFKRGMIPGAAAEAGLREKLRKIEALFAGAATAGERAAADAAASRIRARLGRTAATEAPIEIRFSVPDNWSRQLFIALCRRYGITPFRYRRLRRQTVIVKAPRSFVEQVLWPEFQELSAALTAYLAEIGEANSPGGTRRDGRC
jgi:hypothetical protein